MRIPAKRAIALPLAALSAVALTGVVASTASAATVTSGSVTLTVNASFLAGLAKSGIGFVPQNYTSISYANGAVTVTFAASGGDASITSEAGQVDYTGGIIGFDLCKRTSVDLNTLVFDLSYGAFFGETSTSGGEVQLLDLAGSQQITTDGTNNTYAASDLVLDQAGADYLNSALGTTAFSGGMDVGSFTTTWVG
jgi:hypothetical protein